MRDKAVSLIEGVFDSEDFSSLKFADQAKTYCLLAIAAGIVYVGDSLRDEISVRTRVQPPV